MSPPEQSGKVNCQEIRLSLVFNIFITPVYFHTLSLSHPPQPSFTPLTTTGYLPPPRHTIPPHPLSFGYLPSLPPHPHYAHHLKVDHFYSPDTILQAEEELWPYYTQAHFFSPGPQTSKKTLLLLSSHCAPNINLCGLLPNLHYILQFSFYIFLIFKDYLQSFISTFTNYFCFHNLFYGPEPLLFNT